MFPSGWMITDNKFSEWFHTWISKRKCPQTARTQPWIILKLPLLRQTCKRSQTHVGTNWVPSAAISAQGLWNQQEGVSTILFCFRGVPRLREKPGSAEGLQNFHGWATPFQRATNKTKTGYHILWNIMKYLQYSKYKPIVSANPFTQLCCRVTLCQALPTFQCNAPWE